MNSFIQWFENLFNMLFATEKIATTITPTVTIVQSTINTPLPNTPVIAPVAVHQTSTSKIDLWCKFTQIREGWYPGSISYINNNPGNLKFHGQPLAINTGLTDGSQFCKFKTYTDGYATLKNMFIADCSGHSTVHPSYETIRQYYQGILEKGIYVNGYAPASDNNDPLSYSDDAAHAMGVPVTTQIKDLL